MNKVKLKSFVHRKDIRKILGKSNLWRPLTDDIAQLLLNLEWHSKNMTNYPEYHNPDLGVRCMYNLAEAWLLVVCDRIVLEMYAKEVHRPIIDVLLKLDVSLLTRDSYALFKELFDKDHDVRAALYFFDSNKLEFQPSSGNTGPLVFDFYAR